MACFQETQTPLRLDFVYKIDGLTIFLLNSTHPHTVLVTSTELAANLAVTKASRNAKVVGFDLEVKRETGISFKQSLPSIIQLGFKDVTIIIPGKG
jgi:hypothetical protein